MKNSKSVSGLIFDIVNTILMVGIFLFMLYPFLYLLFYSLSTPSEAVSTLLLFPRGFTLRSYAAIFKDSTVYHAFFISAARSVIGAFSMIVISGMGAYALSRPDLIFGKFFRVFFVFTMYFSAGIVPVYLLMQWIGLTGTFWVYIIPTMANVFNMILIKTYIEGLPPSLEEAVLIDGGNEIIAFFRVILPLCMPVNAAVMLFTFITQWNSFIDTQLYCAMQKNLHTLQYVLYNIVVANANKSLEAAQASGGTNVSSMSLKMAITVITIIPVMFVYPFLRKYFVSGLLVGAIKS